MSSGGVVVRWVSSNLGFRLLPVTSVVKVVSSVPVATVVTALHYTAARGHTEAAATLIWSSEPAMLEALSDRGTTPLQLASETGHVAVIEALAAAGGNLAAAADDGAMSPLHVAAAMGHADAVSALLGAGASVDPRDRRQRTPLALAASYGQAEVTAVLLAAGADASAKDAAGQSAREAAGEHAEAAAAFDQHDEL